MSEWKPIETAPRNEPGAGVGPWIMVFSEWDHGRYQARWECHGETGGWRFLGRKPGPWSSKHYVKNWMPLAPLPWSVSTHNPEKEE